MDLAAIPGWALALIITNVGMAIYQIATVRNDIKHMFTDVREVKAMAIRAHERIDMWHKRRPSESHET